MRTAQAGRNRRLLHTLEERDKSADLAFCGGLVAVLVFVCFFF